MATKRRPSFRWLAPVILSLIVVEYWVAPLRTYDVALADEEAYAALAELPGRGAVVHVPVLRRPVLADSTAYMLGSTLHWRPLVNGYSGFLPTAVLRLAGLKPFSQRFFDFIEAEAPVEFVVLHGDMMDAGQFEGQRTTADASRYLERVGEYGNTVVYRWRPQAHSGVLLNRRFAWTTAVTESSGLEVRRMRGRALGVELSWGKRIVDRISLKRNWQALTVPPATAADREADGSVRLGLRIAPRARWARPLGTTGTSLQADVLVDVQRARLAVAVSDVWQVIERGRSAVLCVVLSADGRHVISSSRFDADDGGIHLAAAYVESLAPGTVVAFGIRLAEPAATNRAASSLRSLIRSLGGHGAANEPEHSFALLGVRGATPGSALEQQSHNRAAVRAGPPNERLPTFEMRMATPHLEAASTSRPQRLLPNDAPRQ